MKQKVGLSFGASLDFLSYPVGFNVQGQSTVKTKVGAVLSIICLAIFVTLSWVTIANYLDTSRPVISYETQSTQKKTPVNIKKSRLYPIIFFYDQVNYLKPSEFTKYVDPQIIYLRNSLAGPPIRKNLKLVACKELIARGKTDTITVESEGTIKEIYKEFGYCIDDEGMEIELGLEDGPELYSVGLYPCALTDGSCMNPAEIGKFVSAISFPEAVTNLGDYKTPVTYITETSSWVGINTAFYTMNYHSLRVNEVMQERGFLSKLETTHKYVSVDKTTTQLRNRNPAQTTCYVGQHEYCLPYIVHNFIMTNKKLQIVRSYKGFVESISEIGGMIDLIFLCFALIYSFYHSSAINRFLAQKIYGVQKQPMKLGLCIKKSKSEVSDVNNKENLNSDDIYNRTVKHMLQDLDLVTLVKELNCIKLFLSEHFGMALPGEGKRESLLKELGEAHQKAVASPNRPADSDDPGLQYQIQQSPGKPWSTRSIRRDSKNLMHQHSNSSAHSSNRADGGGIKYKKSLLMGRKSLAVQNSKFAQVKPGPEPQAQVLDYELAQNGQE